MASFDLVSLAGEVVGKALDSGGGISGDSTLTVVGDDDGLLRLGHCYTGTTLEVDKLSAP